MFKPNDGRPAIPVSSLDEIREYMGDIMYDFGEMEVVSGNIVVTYLHGQPIVLGHLI